MYGSQTSDIVMALWTRVCWPCALQARLQRQPVDDRRQHAHVVGGRALHATRAGRLAAPDVAAADDDGDLDAERDDLRHLRAM